MPRIWPLAALAPAIVLAAPPLIAQEASAPVAAPAAPVVTQIAVPATMGPIPAIAAAIPGVAPAGAKLEMVRDGFNGTEGAVGMKDGSLLFCEQGADHILRLGLDGKISMFVEHANRAIGLAIDPRGRVIAAESRIPRIGVLYPREQTLADSYGGQMLVKPNDLVLDRKGGIYFTDPLSAAQSAFRPNPPGRKNLVFYLRANGEVVKLTEGVTEPNGIQLSPDGKVLYAVNGSHVDAFDVKADGTVANQRNFADVKGDGMAMDNAGRLFVATATGIEVIAPSGERLGTIPSPLRIQSLAFAGKDRRTFYAIGSGRLFRIRTTTPGILSRIK